MQTLCESNLWKCLVLLLWISQSLISSYLSYDSLVFIGLHINALNTNQSICFGIIYREEKKPDIEKNEIHSVYHTLYVNYHIFCCNNFVFACPIIVRSQCCLFALRVNIRICPQISILALKHLYFPPNLTSGICAVISKKICQSTRKDGVYNHISIKLTRFKILE